MIRLTIIPLFVFAALAAAAPPEAAPKADKAPAVPPGLSVAVLDYEASAPGNPKLGTQMADILTARLSVEDSFDLVERDKLAKILEEQKLKLVGLVDQNKAAEVGKLVGAKLLVMGKAFVMDNKLMIVTKVVGVQTGLVKGSIRSVELTKPLSEAIMLLAEDIAALIKKNAEALLPKGTELIDPVTELNKKLGDRPRPTVAVLVPEEHVVRGATVIIIDPAVETEIKKVLLACGFEIVDTGKNDLADWARSMFEGKQPPWPAALADADYVIVGEAFSEFALRTGDLLTCAARAEINVIDRKTGKIVAAERHTDRAVDLAQDIAAKTALQKTGRKLALCVVAHFAETLPAREAKKQAKKEK